jgi:hypothetical protein
VGTRRGGRGGAVRGRGSFGRKNAARRRCRGARWNQSLTGRLEAAERVEAGEPLCLNLSAF